MLFYSASFLNAARFARCYERLGSLQTHTHNPSKKGRKAKRREREEEETTDKLTNK